MKLLIFFASVLLISVAPMINAQDALENQCTYLACNNGTCTNIEGIEFCNCTGTDHTGLTCEIPLGTCHSGWCENGGSCFNYNGALTCACLPGFSGPNCRIPANTTCVESEEGDKNFFPECTLKETLTMVSECVNKNFPYIENVTHPEFKTCSSKVVRTVNCIYDVVNSCSDLLCPFESMYWHGGLEIYQAITAQLYDYDSPFMHEIFEMLCTSPIFINGTLWKDPPFNIGSPVCSNDVIDNLYYALSRFGINSLQEGFKTCSGLDSLRQEIYEIVNKSCDWRNFTQTKLFNAHGSSPQYWQEVFSIAHQFFLEWRAPGCENTGLSCEAGGCGYGGSCINGICHCHSGHTGQFCQYYNGSSCLCQNEGTCYMGKCYCQHGYSGQYCEMYIGSPCDSVNCGAGGSCSGGVCYCFPDYTGQHCEHYIGGSTCGTHDDCQHGGSCYGGTCYCLSAYTGPNCEHFFNVTCDHMYCGSGGSCYQGVCYCYPDYTGEYCQHHIGSQCPENYCMNGGYCSVLFTGTYYCTCPEMRSGDRCQTYNASAVCPRPGDDDVELFPACTLRTTFDQTMHCLGTLNMKIFGQADQYTCSGAISTALECLGNMVSRCSGRLCTSIYDIPGTSDIIQNVFALAADPTVFQGVATIMCTADGLTHLRQYLQTAVAEANATMLDVGLGLICPGISLRDLPQTLGQVITSLAQSTDLQQTCSIIRDTKSQAYEVITSSCNLGLLDGLSYVPGLSEIVPYVRKGAHVVISILRNYTVPFCRGVEPVDYGCPLVSAASSPSEMVDAYRCSLFMYSKAVSTWLEDLIKWGSGFSQFVDRDWHYFAVTMGWQPSYGSRYGEQAFLDMLRANLMCSQTSSGNCYMGMEFVDVLGCMHCYRRGAGIGSNEMRMMQWAQLHHQHMLFSKLYATLAKEIGADGSGYIPTSPPFTDFTTGFTIPFNRTTTEAYTRRPTTPFGESPTTARPQPPNGTATINPPKMTHPYVTTPINPPKMTHSDVTTAINPPKMTHPDTTTTPTTTITNPPTTARAGPPTPVPGK